MVAYIYAYLRDLRLFRDVENVGELATTPGVWALPFISNYI